MVRQIYHFYAEKPDEDLLLSSNHKLVGYIAQYLKSFQFDGIRFLYRQFELNQSCILNDDSGFGKTMQITAFLSAIFTSDSDKKCLIIVKDEERVINWKFHLSAFTKFRIKMIFKKEDDLNENIYLTKWNSILKSTSLQNLNFDYIIVDNRDELLSNQICLNHLLKYYTNKISLIVASTDVVMDLKLFHSMLKLCGLLDKEYKNLNYFEEKFSLPSPRSNCHKDILEAYFIRREKIINFCRNFRLRRYRHQFEDQLPLATSDEYEKSIELWKESAIKVSSHSSSDSIKIISSSDKDTEELFEAFFTTKEERKLDKEISKIISEKRESTEEVIMSPLLFESDSEDMTQEKQSLKNNDNKDEKLRQNDEIIEQSEIKPNKNLKTVRKKRNTRGKNKEIRDDSFLRQTRSSSSSSIITRSKAQKNKTPILDISENMKKFALKIKKLRKPRRIRKDKSEEKHQIKIETSNNLPASKKLSSKNLLENENLQRNLSLESKYDFNIDLLNKSTLLNSNYQNNTDLHIITPLSDEIIVLSSSIKDDEKQIEKVNNTEGDVSPSPDLFNVTTTPIETTENGDDYNITCTQKYPPSLFNKKKNSKVYVNSSKLCMVMIPRSHRNENQSKKKCNNEVNNSTNSRKIKEISSKFCNSIKNEKNVNINDTVSTVETNTLNQSKSKNDNKVQNNKITKYLVGNKNNSETSIELQSSLESSEDDFVPKTIDSIGNRKIQFRRNSEFYDKTPKRQKLQQQQRCAVTSAKKSPKSIVNTTPNSLTKWLIKPDNKSPKKIIKRRRLDISFQNL